MTTFLDHYNEISSLYLSKQYDEALEKANTAIMVFATSSNLFNLRACIHRERGNLTEAAQDFRNSLTLQYNSSAVWNNLANTYRMMGDVLGSTACYEQSFALDEKNILAHKGLMWALAELHQHARVKDLYASWIEKNYQDDVDVFSAIAFSLSKTGEYEESLKYYKRVDQKVPNNIAILANIMSISFHLTDYKSCILTARKILKLDPKHNKAQLAICKCALKQNKFKKAIELYKQHLNQYPEDYDAIFDLACTYIMIKDYDNGFKLYEERFNAPVFHQSVRKFDTPRWKGEDLKDKTILIYEEQGYGDSIQFVRYIKLIKDYFEPRKIIFEVATPLLELYKFNKFNLGLEIEFIEKGTPIPDHDYNCALISILYCIKRRMQLGYLAIIKSAFLWNSYITKFPTLNFELPEGKKIGIVWSGNPNHADDHNRLTKLEYFKPFSELPRVKLISLQKNLRSKEVETCGFEVIDVLSDKITDFSVLAAVINECELVITVDTAVAHLAGAMGKPCYVLLPHACDWRWSSEGEYTIWYPSVKLFRQTKPRDWVPVFKEVEKCLVNII